MFKRKKAVFNWSGGKDSALALQNILEDNEYEVVSLLTTIKEETLTTPIHSIPLAILERQAESIGIPLYTVLFAENLNNYGDKMRETVGHFKEQGVTHFIFGDIFLEDVKSYRENKLNPLGIEVVEPLWNKSSAEVIDEFLKSGIKAKIIVTKADKLNENYIAKDLDRAIVDSFPDGVDPCGENGEYHTLSYSGRLFKTDVAFSILRASKISYANNLADGEATNSYYWQAEIGE